MTVFPMAFQLQTFRVGKNCNKGLALMENRNLALEYSLPEEEPLTLPHFDDEVTVQSARPVVPLHEVESSSRSRQKKLLIASLCLAALVGAVAASFVFSDRAQDVEESATVTIPESSEDGSTGFIAASGEAGGATVDPSETIATDIETTRVDRTEDEPEVQTPTIVSRPQPVKNARVPKPVEKDVKTEAEPEDLEADERQTRREERREARRLRRERRAGDGLTRIREIFEGSPRP